jgi:transcriptional regulatory protein LEU3
LTKTRFLEHYASALPGIIDRGKSADAVYESSNFLFWTIVYVGARKYSKDPTIVECLTKPLKELIQKSLFDPDNAISTIMAALLLCLWPLPVNSTFKDQSHAIAGAAMQLAVQQGLPYSSRQQDFVRVALRQSAADKLFRGRLWAHCVTVFQRCAFLS